MQISRTVSLVLAGILAIASGTLAACSIRELVDTKTTPAMQSRGIGPKVKLSEADVAGEQFNAAVRGEIKSHADAAEAAEIDGQAELDRLTTEYQLKAKDLRARVDKTKAGHLKAAERLGEEAQASNAAFKASIQAAEAKASRWESLKDLAMNPATWATIGLPVGGLTGLASILTLLAKAPGTDKVIAKEKEDSFNAGLKKGAAIVGAPAPATV
ncbi:MAG TPA: hypothetical protein VFF65_12855 [Phycisphaerales bacterium]|nr:hypothetical protein [Phycisphaerales bacterium]